MTPSRRDFAHHRARRRHERRQRTVGLSFLTAAVVVSALSVAGAITGVIPLGSARAADVRIDATMPTVSPAESARLDLIVEVDDLLARAATPAGHADTDDDAPTASAITDATAALQVARDLAAASSDAATAATDLTAAVNTFVTAVADAQVALLGTYSDAAREREDALFVAADQLRTASPDTAATAFDTARAAAEAVVADAEAWRAQLIEDSSATNTQPVDGDVDAQLSYLQTYALDYNSDEWGNWNPRGGDCVNFTSQGLIQRGWVMDSTWRWASTSSASQAWVWVPAMKWYFDDLGLSYSTEDDLDRVRIGDVGIFDWGENGLGMDHAMTVSKVEYTADGPVVFFVSHNADGQYRELNTALYEEHTDSTVKIFHIP